MKRGIILAVCGLVLLSLAANAQEPKTTEVNLDNGLRVILRENHNAPIISVVIGYKVGVRNEHLGVTGISHLVEHMNYKGTKKYSEMDLQREIETSGEFNGMTGPDSTIYYQTFPKDKLKDILAVEADRMVNCTFDPKELLKERTVVVSELEGKANDPIQRFFSDVFLSFIQVHPYRWISLAQKDDVERTTRETAYSWYKQHYVPNNAVLVLVGDFNTDEAMKAVKDRFGSIKRGADVDQYAASEPPIRGQRRIEVKDMFPVPLVGVGSLTPGSVDDDMPAISILNSILADGRSCRLYKSVVDAKLGEEVVPQFISLKDLGLMLYFGVGSMGGDPAKLRDAIESTIQSVIDAPPTEDEMTRAKKMAKAAFIFGGDTVNEVAIQLCSAEIDRTWKDRDQYVTKIEAVTPADVQRVAKKYLNADRRLFATLLPAGMPGLGPMGGGDTPPTPAPTEPKAIAAAVPDKTAPASAEPVRKKLANGMVVIVQENHTYPTVSYAGEVQAGATRDAKGKEGLANLVASTLNQGTKTRTAEEIAGALEGMGANISFGAGKETLGFDGTCLTEDIDKVMDIASDCILNPVFPENEVEKAKRQIQITLAQNETDSQNKSMRAIIEAMLPEGNGYRHDTNGTAQSVAGLTRDDCAAHQAKWFRPDQATLVIVGDIAADRAFALAEKCFGGWKAEGEIEKLDIAKTIAPEGIKRIAIPMADKVQDDIFLGFPCVGELDKDISAQELLNVVLGSAFTSRIPQAVRKEAGLAYVSNSGIMTTRYYGLLFVYTGTAPENVNRAIDLIAAEIKKLRSEGMTADELTWAKRYLTERRPITLETNESRAMAYRTAEHFGRPMGYVADYPNIINKITLAEVNAVAKRLLPENGYYVAIAGPEVKE